MNKIWQSVSIGTAFKSSLILFTIAAFFGFVLRMIFATSMPEWVVYPYVRHAHSHAALLGWLTAAFVLSIIRVYNLDWARYRSLFLLMQGTVFVMTFAFPFMGYKPFTIFFTTAHILLSYVLLYKMSKSEPLKKMDRISRLFVLTAFIFFVIASLGPWFTGLILALGEKGSNFYYESIQWYLHFLFNGWLVYGLFAVIFGYFHNQKIDYDKKAARTFYYLLTIATCLTFALAITWSTPVSMIFYVNSTGVIIQLISLIYLIVVLKSTKIKWSSFSPLGRTMIQTSLFAYFMKVVIQGMVVAPFVAKMSYTIRNFVVGFIHLLMLGCLTLFIYGVLIEIFRYSFSKWGSRLMIVGIVITEILLFLQGLLLWMQRGFMPAYYQNIAFWSFILFVGVLITTITFKNEATETSK